MSDDDGLQLAPGVQVTATFRGDFHDIGSESDATYSPETGNLTLILKGIDVVAIGDVIFGEIYAGREFGALWWATSVLADSADVGAAYWSWRGTVPIITGEIIKVTNNMNVAIDCTMWGFWVPIWQLD